MATSPPVPVARARRHVPVWLIAAIAGVAVGVGATSLVDGSGKPAGSAAKANPLLFQPGTCVQEIQGPAPGPGHC